MTREALVKAALLAGIFAGVAAWCQSRLGHRGWRRIVWPATAFVFSTLGFAVFLVRNWDAHAEPCPACGRPRPVQRDLCPHCAAPWPAPARTGAEVCE